MSQKDDINKELEAMGSRLRALSDSSPEGDVPKGYFEDLQENLETRLFDIEAENQGRVRKLWTITSLLAAACIALFFMTRVPGGQDVSYPDVPELTDMELFYMDEFEVDDLEGLLTSYETEEIDAESILLEEDLEDLINM